MTDPSRKKTFLSFYEQVSENRAAPYEKNGHAYPGLGETVPPEESEIAYENESSTFLTEEIDHKILMHRDVHFGGDFGVMLNYYNNDSNVGIDPDLEIERITYLAQVEKEIGQDLAPVLLTATDAEAVGKARRAYSQIKEIYEIDAEKNPFPRLIADLILSEDEEPSAEIEAIVSQGTLIVPELTDLLQVDDFYDALYPGYGYAPYLAILCLSQIKDSRAIVPLFETLNKQIVFDEMVIVEALASIGEPAKEFLLKILKSRPVTQDNIHAAFALIAFSDDTSVAMSCFEQLQDPSVQEMPLLRTYLLSCLTSLVETPYKEEFVRMAQDANTPKELRSEMQLLLKEWHL